MNKKNSPREILEEIATIERMERGKLSVIRQGPNGPYFNLQRREGGRNVTEYVPAEQVAEAQENIEAHHRFEALMEEYASVISTQSREARKDRVKKKRRSPASHSPKKPKSKT